MYNKYKKYTNTARNLGIIMAERGRGGVRKKRKKGGEDEGAFVNEWLCQVKYMFYCFYHVNYYFVVKE